MRQSLGKLILILTSGLLWWFASSLLAASGPPLTRAEVAKHSTKENCWMIINNEVFDITTYLANHPPPLDIVVQECGRDGTLGWNTKGSKNKPHSKKAHVLLQKYKIGILKD